MTPAELNHWAATDVMGWQYWVWFPKEANSESLPRVMLYEYSDHPPFRDRDKPYREPYDKNRKAAYDYSGVHYWNPCGSHDDCQRVIEKAIERGVEPTAIVRAISWQLTPGFTAGTVALLATAEQKLRAVYAAWMEMEKK